MPGNTQQPPTGRQLRDAGITDCLTADAAIHRNARTEIERALDALARTGREFSVDDLRSRLPTDIEPHHANLIPSVFGAWSGAGLIRPTGWVRSTRPSRHASAVRVWVGGPAPAEEAA